MTRTEELFEAYQGIEAAQASANKAASEAKALLNEELLTCSPVKIGDIVEANGYSYTGKKMVVERLWFTITGWKGDGIMAKGPIIKADGSPSLNEGDHFIKIGEQS